MSYAGLEENVQPLTRASVTPPQYYGELGYEDQVLKSGRWRFLYPIVREFDPLHYDPLIKNSMLGPGGLELGRTPETLYRERPGSTSYEEWRDRRYFMDPNVKAIYEKFPIAKQHPGLGFRPTGIESELSKKDYLNGHSPTIGFIRHWPGILPQNWKFFGAPFGEDCHVKTAVAARTGLIIGTAYFITKAPMLGVGLGWRYLFNVWYRYNSYTVPLGAAWAAASCISCNLRGKDDAWNMVAGGVGFGAVYGARKGFFAGYHISLGATLLGIIWYQFASFEQGLFGKTPAPFIDNNAFTWDPSSHKLGHWERGFDKQPWNF